MLPNGPLLLNRMEIAPDNSRHLAAESATAVTLWSRKFSAGTIDAMQHKNYAA